MRIEKREVTLIEKDTLLDMLLFEQALAERYQQLGEKAERKEVCAAFLAMADELQREVEKLKRYFQKPPKM